MGVYHETHNNVIELFGLHGRTNHALKGCCMQPSTPVSVPPSNSLTHVMLRPVSVVQQQAMQHGAKHVQYHAVHVTT